jgi:hypothetical protein
LERQVGDDSGRRAGEIVRNEAQVRQRLELKGVAKAVVIAATIADQIELGV